MFVGSFRSPFAEGEAAAHADGTKNPFSVNPRTPPKAAEKTNIIAGATIIFLMSIVFVVVFIVVFSFSSFEEEEEDGEEEEEEEEERITECRRFGQFDLLRRRWRKKFSRFLLMIIIASEDDKVV